jgi:hypothetical protein
VKVDLDEADRMVHAYGAIPKRLPAKRVPGYGRA